MELSGCTWERVPLSRENVLLCFYFKDQGMIKPHAAQQEGKTFYLKCRLGTRSGGHRRSLDHEASFSIMATLQSMPIENRRSCLARLGWNRGRAVSKPWHAAGGQCHGCMPPKKKAFLIEA